MGYPDVGNQKMMSTDLVLFSCVKKLLDTKSRCQDAVRDGGFQWITLKEDN